MADVRDRGRPRYGRQPYGGPSTGKPNVAGARDQHDTGKPPPDGTPASTPPGTGGTGAPAGPLAGLDPGLQAVLYAGIPTPPVAPFLTPEQMTALSQAFRDYNISVGDLDYQLGVQNIDTSYQKGQSNRKAVMDTEAANDNAVRRGIFQSSIRDSDLADIQATNATAKGRLDDLLAAATIHTDTQKRALKGALDDMRQNYNVLAATNAADVGKDQNPWIAEPNKAFAPTPPTSAGAGGTGSSSGGSSGDIRDRGLPSDGPATHDIRDRGLPSDGPAGHDIRDTGIPGSGDQRDTHTLPPDPIVSKAAAAHARVAAGVWTPSKSASRRRG